MRPGEAYPGEWENLAEQARRDRQRRLAQGWHNRGGWEDPASLLRALNEAWLDPCELRELAAARERERRDRLNPDPDSASVLRWLGTHTCVNLGPE